MGALSWIKENVPGADTVADVAEDVADYGSEVVNDVVETGGEVLDAGGEVVSDVVDYGAGVANDVVDYGGEVVNDVVETGGEVLDAGSEVVNDVVDYGGGLVNDAVEYGGGVVNDLSEAASAPFTGLYDGVDPTMAAAGGAGSAFEHWVVPGLHALEGVVKHGGPAAKFLGKALPPVAAGLATYHYQQGGNSKGNEKWDHYGSAMLNGLSVIPGVGANIGAVELGWNGVQALAGWGLHDDSHFYEKRGGNMNQVTGYLMSRFAHDDEATSLIERTRERDRAYPNEK